MANGDRIRAMTDEELADDRAWLIKAWIDSEPYPATLITPPTTVLLETAKRMREEMGINTKR